VILYLYAIVDGLDSVEGRRGAASEPLQLLTLESLTTVAGELPATLPLDRAALLAQDRVVCELHAQATALLPMRFGAGFADQADVARALKTLAPALHKALEQVRGREQMTVRVLGTGRLERSAISGPPRSSETTGTEYLQGRAARAVPAEVAPLLKAVERLQRATRVEAGTAAGVIATMYQLIERGSSDEYREVVRAAAAALTVSVRISGPSPCYAFATT
jgi:hypothetical protein